MQGREYTLSEAMALFRTQKINNFVDDDMKKSEFSVLITITKYPVKVSAIDLSKYFNCTKVYIGKVLDSLIEKGLIKRDVSTKDKRKYYLSATEKGKQVVEDHIEIYMKTVKELYNSLGEEKAEELIRVLNEASGVLREIERKNK